MRLRRIVGIFFIISAVVGIVLSLIGLIEIWRFRPRVTKIAVDNLALVDQTLTITQETLTTVGQMVQIAKTDATSLQDTIQAVALAINDINPGLDALINLTSNDFPATVSATQTSLASAQSSALLIDNMMSALNSVPFINVGAYNPAVPLHTSLAQVSASLETLTPALETIKSSLVDGKTNLVTVEAELVKISETMQDMSSTLDSAQADVDRYKVVTTQLMMNVEAAQRAAPSWILSIAWILSFILSWLFIAQLGLCLQGLENVKGGIKT